MLDDEKLLKIPNINSVKLYADLSTFPAIVIDLVIDDFNFTVIDNVRTKVSKIIDRKYKLYDISKTRGRIELIYFVGDESE